MGDTIQLGRAQMDVLLLTAEGLTSKQIAQKKGISQKTVEAEKYTVLKKFGAKSMVQAVILAFKMGMIEHPEAFTKMPKTKSIKYLKDGKIARKTIII
jgi:DNA-binding CsgD family transcriptional regulator